MKDNEPMTWGEYSRFKLVSAVVLGGVALLIAGWRVLERWLVG